jgi:predicted ATP-grasp superfamily ATP-dependent carboligase
VGAGLCRTADECRTVNEWLVKPLASGGGQRIHRWTPGDDVPPGYYLQELVEGPPGSVVFIAAGGRAVLLGISRQIVGEQAFGAAGYQYCGNILAGADLALADTASALAAGLTEEFGLVGLNGIDFIVRDGVPYAIEVNPRWCASMELVERARGFPVLGAHASACAGGGLPVLDLLAWPGAGREGPAAFGKAVVYARRDVAIGDTQAWLATDDIRDIPRPGGRIAAGRPVCTVFATGRDAEACHDALAASAMQIYAQLDKWEGRNWIIG